MKFKNLLVLFFILFLSTKFYSQEPQHKNTLSAEFGINQHGTGDINGFSYGLKFNHPLSKTFDLILGFEGNLNDSKGSAFFFDDPNGNTYDSTPHNVIAGLQINAGIGLNILNSKKHKFGLNPNIFGRYQALSAFSTIITDYPALTGYPIPIRTYIREEPGNTTTLGASVKIFYNYRINEKLFVGLNPGFQVDFNGDTMIFTTLAFGITL